MFYNPTELMASFYNLQDAVFEFYSDAFFDDEQVNERAQALNKLIDEAYDKHNMSGKRAGKGKRDWLKKIVNFQLKRINQRIKIETFKNSLPQPPLVRIGALDYELDQDEYSWFKEVCEKQNVSMPEWAEKKMSATVLYFPPIKEKHWVQFSWGYNHKTSKHGVGFLPNYPDFSTLKKMQSLSVYGVSSNVTISSNERMEKLNINGQYIEHLILEGNNNLGKLDISYCENLKLCDITKNHIVELYEIYASGSKNITLKCSEAQYKFSNAIRKCRVKKIQVPAQSEEIHYYVQHYNWDNGYSFLKWVIKHPECELATALTVFWLGKPLYFKDKTVEEVEAYNLDNFKLLKQIEKRVQKKKYKIGSLTFDINDYLDSAGLDTARQSFAEVMLGVTS